MRSRFQVNATFTFQYIILYIFLFNKLQLGELWFHYSFSSIQAVGNILVAYNEV